MGGAVISRIQRLGDDRLLHRDVVEVLLGEELFDEELFVQLAAENRVTPESHESNDGEYITGRQLKQMVEKRNASLSMSFDSAADSGIEISRVASSEGIPEDTTAAIASDTDGCEIRVIDFEKFAQLGRLPRYPEDADVCVPIAAVDKESSLTVYICHNWLRPTPESVSRELQVLHILESCQLVPALFVPLVPLVSY